MNTVEQASRLPISFLRERNYFSDGLMGGGITWSIGGERTGGISFRVSARDMYIQLLYTVKDHASGEVQDMDYKVPLLKTLCHFGGYRYWFQCNYCHRRVGVLYINTYARCRRCSRLCYASQKANRLGRSIGSKGYMYMLEEEYRAMRTTHYAGKPTKRYLRFLKHEGKAERGLSLAMMQL